MDGSARVRSRPTRWFAAPACGLRVAVTPVVVALVLLPGCSDGNPATIVAEEQVAAAEERFEPVDQEGALFEELRAGDADADAIEAFVGVAYSPGIVFDDVSFGVRDEGRDDVADMFATFLSYFGDAEISWRPTLVGAETAVSVIEFGGVRLGSQDFTVDDPLVEVDLLAVDDGRISSNVLFYETGALERLFGGPTIPGDVESYVAAWNSGRTDRMLALYASDATRTDGVVLGEAARPVRESVERFASALDGATWTLDLAFAQAGGDRSGAVLDVATDGCDATVAVVWTFDSAGSIIDEIVHYEPSSIVGCPWVEPSS